MKKSLIKTICFCIVLLLVLNYVNNVFKFKYGYGEGIYDWVKFYELEPDTVDVLILGSSHAYQSFNTGVLWDEYGMASFVLGGSVQPMWNTYYYLKEALKTQTPQLILLEGYMTTFSAEYIEDSRIIKNTYGLKWSKNKIDAIKASSPEDRWSEFLLEYFQYHTRYTDLSRADFFSNQGNPLYEDWKGFCCNMWTQPFETIEDVTGITEKGDMYDKTEMYYRMIIELAQENNIPILVVISPYAGINAWEQAIYNTAEDIASEYDVPFINYNLSINDIGLDFTTDVADIGHLNYRGNQKYTNAVGKYIKEEFSIPDRRGDTDYQTWENHADFIACMIQNQEFAETTDINEIITKIQNPNFTLIVSVDGNCTTGDETLAPLFDALGIPRNGEGGFWYITNPVGVYYSSGAGEAEKYMRSDYHDFLMTRTFDEKTQTYVNTVLIDNMVNKCVVNGVNLRIYNNVTQTLVDSFGFNMDASYQLVRP